MRFSAWKIVPVGLIMTTLFLLVACGSAAEPPKAPAQEAGAAAIQPTAAPIPSGITSARDEITLVLPEEPVRLGSMNTIGASLNASVTRSNLQDPLTWQSGDDLRIVPTSATTGWEQMDEDTWRFNLREGVKFHNGEEFNAEAAIPSLTSSGDPTSPGGSINYTGPFTAEVVDDFTVDINCAQACPIFPSTSFFANFEAPEWYASAPEEESTRTSVGFGPYQLVEWSAGTSITMEAYEDYVTVGDHFEFQKPAIQNLKWVWRGEPLVIAAMIKTGEADIGWDVSVDAIGNVPENMLRAGTSAETYAMTMNTLWHPELKKKQVRQAIVHAINCQELVDALYGGLTNCRGNIIWPGITGATEANTAPYKYDPTLSRQLLKDADYNPENGIQINMRAVRVAKQIEISEAVVGYLTDVGINIDFQVVDPSIRSAMSKCGAGKALQGVLKDSGRDMEFDTPTNADYQALIDRGGSDCQYIQILGNQPSNETLDGGRQAKYYMSCESNRSGFCDPSPGGIQERIGPALEAAGQDRKRLMEDLFDRFHEEVVMIPLFDLPVYYAVDPKLNWTPRLDPVIRVSGMSFSE